MRAIDPAVTIRKPFPMVLIHLSLCAACLYINATRYSLGHSLYYWWFSPFDIAAILLVTPLYMTSRLARLGYGISCMLSVLEVAALVFLGVTLVDAEAPFTSNLSSLVAWGVAVLVAVRIPIGWLVAAAAPPMSAPSRGCAP